MRSEVSGLSEASQTPNFRGKVQDVFVLQDKGLVLSLTEVEGVPRVGEAVWLRQERHKILEVGRNSTDGKAVSTRSCLTGRTVAPYGGICIDWDGSKPDDLRDEWVVAEGQA